MIIIRKRDFWHDIKNAVLFDLFIKKDNSYYV